MTGRDTEDQLIERAKAGDSAAMSQILLIYYDPLHQHVSNRISVQLQGIVRPEDILQLVFMRSARAISRFERRHDSSVWGWLKTIADNLVRDAEKGRRRERRGDARPCGAGEDPISAREAAGPLIDDRTTPGHGVQRRESLVRLRNAIGQLPEEQREVVRRRYLNGQSLNEIAESCDLSKEAVRGLCYRARKNLKTLMGRTSMYFSR